jgi:hypothetical protein
MEDRIAAGNVKVRDPVVNLTEVLTVGHNILHLFPCHCFQIPATGTGKNITVFAALVTFICDMPLKCEILTHQIHPPFPMLSYLSSAPQAVPQAADFF